MIPAPCVYIQTDTVLPDQDAEQAAEQAAAEAAAALLLEEEELAACAAAKEAKKQKAKAKRKQAQSNSSKSAQIDDSGSEQTYSQKLSHSLCSLHHPDRHLQMPDRLICCSVHLNQ